MRNLELSELTLVNGGSLELQATAMIAAAAFGAIFMVSVPRILASYGFNYVAPVDGTARIIISDFNDLMGTLSSTQQNTINAYIGHVTESAQTQGFINGLQRF